MSPQEEAMLEARNRGYVGAWPDIDFSKLVRELYKETSNYSHRSYRCTQSGISLFPAVMKHLLESNLGFKVNDLDDRNDTNVIGGGVSYDYKKYTSKDMNTNVEFFIWKEGHQVDKVEVYLHDELPF